jgi:hypothetical protein
MEAVKTFECDHGVTAEIVPDEEQFASNPRENDNLAVIASIGSEQFGETHHREGAYFNIGEGDDERDVNPVEYYRADSDVVAALGLRYSDYGSSGSAIHITDDEDDVNGVAFVTRERCEELGVEPTREECERQIRGEIDEYDSWLRGDVYGIVVRDADGEVAESVWGFIGDPFAADSYIVSEAKSLGEHVAEEKGSAPAEAEFIVRLTFDRPMTQVEREAEARRSAEKLRTQAIGDLRVTDAKVTITKPRQQD